ncbi:MAG TPA: DUF2459 domain-containing protein [Bacteriovoracaceae bacterium]|nr:DUF2459 domain-containing protein [Bacteriovoracaceae bacterium]
MYVTHNPVHTALMFPYSSDWAVFPEGKFIEFSWGDVDFFVNVPTWDKLTLPLVFHAMVTPDEGLMHVDVINDVGVPSYKLMVTEEQYQELKKFIWDSFKLKDGKPILYPGHSYYGTDNFYQSTVKYHAFNTCNNWTREGLSRAGVRTSLWTPHKWGVLFHLE